MPPAAGFPGSRSVVCAFIYVVTTWKWVLCCHAAFEVMLGLEARYLFSPGGEAQGHLWGSELPSASTWWCCWPNLVPMVLACLELVQDGCFFPSGVVILDFWACVGVKHRLEMKLLHLAVALRDNVGEAHGGSFFCIGRCARPGMWPGSTGSFLTHEVIKHCVSRLSSLQTWGQVQIKNVWSLLMYPSL